MSDCGGLPVLCLSAFGVYAITRTGPYGPAFLRDVSEAELLVKKVIGSLLAAITILPVADPPVASAQSGNMGAQAMLDKPQDQTNLSINERGGAEKGGMSGGITCTYYRTFTVKELELGDKGATAISVTPAQWPNHPRCGKQDDPGEMVLRNSHGAGSVGAKGNYLDVVSALGADTTPFTIYDAVTGKLLYHDEAVGPGQEAISVEGGTLTLRYMRGVIAPCSLISDGQSCWAQTVREAHLVSAVASHPPSPDSCRNGYAKWFEALHQKIDPKDRSVVGYDVMVQIDQTGMSKVIARGAVTMCQPQE